MSRRSRSGRATSTTSTSWRPVRQVTEASTIGSVQWDFDTVYNLAGPIHVEGARSGQTLEVEVLELTPGPWGWTTIIPGFGLLPADFPEGDSTREAGLSLAGCACLALARRLDVPAVTADRRGSRCRHGDPRLAAGPGAEARRRLSVMVAVLSPPGMETDRRSTSRPRGPTRGGAQLPSGRGGTGRSSGTC